MTYISTKIFDGFSVVFRQWQAKETHCKFLHGYDVYFKVWFEGELDERNWVWDFGGMKRAKTLIDGLQPFEWMNYMFDHTVVVAENDPSLDLFKQMDETGVLRLRILPRVGAERFAEFIFQKLQTFVDEETKGRVKVKQVEFFENEKNTAVYRND